MSLDYGLVKQFANITNDSTPEKTDPDILIGTIQANGDVLLDGATSPTPAGTSTANYKTGDRVTCIIENHECKVIGNATAPSLNRPEDIPDGSITDDQLEDGVPRNKSIYRPPTDEDPGTEGEVWFDISNGNSIYIYTNGIWQPKILSGEAIIAPTGNKVWYTATEPTEASNGDTWFKKLANGSYEQYEYSNNQWNAAELSGTSIKARSITASEIATGAITANEISSNYIYSGFIGASQISAGLITGCTYETVGNGIDSGVLSCYYPTKNNWTYNSIVGPGGIITTRIENAQSYSSDVSTNGIFVRGPNAKCILRPNPVLGYIAEFTGGDVKIDGYMAIHTGNVGSYAAAIGHTHSGYASSGHTHGGSDVGTSSNNVSHVYAKKIYLTDPGSSTGGTDLVLPSTNQIDKKSTSTRRVKNSISNRISEELDPEKLYDIEFIQFKYNNDYLKRSDERYDTLVPGFIAEQMNEVYPIAVDHDDSESGCRDWNAKFLIPPMLKLIQEQKKQIDSLEERLAKLER